MTSSRIQPGPDRLPREPEPEPVSEDEQDWLPLWTAPAAVGLGLVAGVFADLFVTLLGSAFGSSATSPTPAVNLVGSLVFDLAFVAVALYFSALRGRPRAAMFGYRRVGWRRAAGAFFGGGILYYVFSYAYGAALDIHGNDKLPSGFGVHRSTAAMLGTAAFVCIAAPICEEFFFRGFVFGVLRRMRVTVGGRALGPWIAALITGTVFGLAHTGSVSSSQYLIPLGFLGFVLCLIRWRTGSLYPCMALHAFNNVLAFGVLLNWTLAGTGALLVISWAAIAVLTGWLAGRRPAGRTDLRMQQVDLN